MNKINVASINEALNIDGDDFIDDDGSCYIPYTQNNPPSWNAGTVGLYKHTEESKKKITGRPGGFTITEEQRVQMSDARKGKRNHFYGKTHTPEAKNSIIARHYKLIEYRNPAGDIVREHTTMRKFCEKYNLDRKSLHLLSKGKAKQHKGWTLV